MATNPLTEGVDDFVDDLLGGQPDTRPYLLGERNQNLTHGDLREAVGAEVSLFAGAGIGPGSTVALQVPPSYTQIEVLLALWTLGAQVMLIDYRFKSAEVKVLHQLCRPQHAVHTGTAAKSLLAFRSRYELVTQRLAGGLPASTEHRLVQFSSGSTGVPKVIGRTARSLAEEITRFTKVDGMPGAGERVLLLSSTAHSFGLIAGLLHSLAVGAEVVFAPMMTASGIVEAAVNHRVDAIFGVPFHYELLGSITRPPRLPGDRAVSGGELMPPEAADRFAERYGFRVGESYGTTETGVIAMDVSGALRPAVGRAAPGVDVRVRDGELEVRLERTPYLTANGQDGYRDGWFRTRDRTTVDGTGSIRLLGRSDSLVVVGGLKVDLTEVEAVLAAHPLVREAALVHDEVIKAYVSADAEDLTVADLTAWCQDRLADYKLPKLFRIVAALPRTPNGKLVRDPSALRTATLAGAS
ncbi:acyl--CoA ligase [Allokutzneria sp. A3M-2-11 16]|uniref:class I adenylate-forming enzyme family protein n=1 Tax=Allokutzneria sp. A3M-2-11 16 TaxID=2962043 RepID=UPI0020B74E09|nr:class I adenylate-forming enzyme family protein [Allokutzneria sp. A3M-2-11 16]MCP3799387.1 acyl--CoA ligase [Allokutzneria sp. A3M-2-11 16]